MSDKAILWMDSSEELAGCLNEAVKQKCDSSLLKNAKSWETVTAEMLEKIQNC